MQISDTLIKIWDNKLGFFGAFFVVFTLLYTLLYVIDFLPEEPEVTSDTVSTTEVVAVAEQVDVTPAVLNTPIEIEDQPVSVTAVPTEAGLSAQTVVSADALDMPTSIYIEKLDKTIDVLNPQSRTIADLDNALLSGVVRHPDSATPNIDGTTLILGHSSYLPNVLNRNFQAFNGVQNLEWGDTITLTSENAIYTYRVERVYEAKASEITVPIAGDEKLLTIATCDSFGSTDDRHIVEAKQISVELL